MNQTKNIQRYEFLTWLVPVLCFLLSLISLYPLSPAIRPYEGNDSSVFLYIGKGLILGQVPYRDIWDHKPPIVYLIDAFGLLLGRGSVWGVFSIQVIFLSVFNFITYKLFSKRIKPILLAVGIIYANIQILSLSNGGNLTSFYTIPLQIAGFWLLDYTIRNHSRFLPGMIAGLLFTTTFLIRPNSIGVFVAFGIVILINRIIKTRKELLQFFIGLALGCAIVAIPILVYFGINHALVDMWDQVFRFNRYYVAGTNIKVIVQTMVYGASLFYHTGIGLICILTTTMLVDEAFLHRKISAERQLALLTFVIDWGMVIYAGKAKLPYFQTLIPASTVLFFYGMEFIQNLEHKEWIHKLSALILIVLLFISYRTEYIENFKAGNKMQQSRGEIIRYVQEHTTPNDPIVVQGTEAWIYLYSQRFPQSRFIYTNMLFFTGYAENGIIQEYFTDIKNSNPKLIIVTIQNGKIFGFFGKTTDKSTRVIAAQLRSEYVEAMRVGEIVIYQRLDNK